MLNARQEAEVVFHMTVSSSILILKTPRIAAIVPVLEGESLKAFQYHMLL